MTGRRKESRAFHAGNVAPVGFVWEGTYNLAVQSRILTLFESHFGTRPEAVLAIPSDGSARRYHRLVAPDGRTAIGAFGPDPEENRAFLSFTKALSSAGLPVPELYAEDAAARVWLLEDLGDITLFRALQEARDATGDPFPAPVLQAYEQVVETLPSFQIRGHEVVDYSVAYPREAFDHQSIAWDLNYFKYHFLKLSHIAFNEARLEDDFQTLTAFLLEADCEHFMYRDFQSRNIMLQNGTPRFIDYQGGRRGAPHYDIASLLYDAKANMPELARSALLERYLDALAAMLDFDRRAFLRHYRGYVLVRILQALGAYGYRGFFERKPRFLQSVPFAARNVERLLASGLPVEVPELEEALHRIAAEWGVVDGDLDTSKLTIHIHSFSYRRGYPEDLGGHGGGFVFDCRAIENPGRRPEYADRTGRDAEVVAFLKAQPEAEAFWNHARSLTETQIAAYLEKGFTSLTVSFGCTGGQHRSVYMAERLAQHLGARFPEIAVRTLHREEPRWPHTGHD